MDTDEDTDDEHEDAPLVASDEQSRREARLRHEPTVWSDDPLANVTLVLLLLLALGGGILTGFYGFDVLMRLASLVRCATPSSPETPAGVVNPLANSPLPSLLLPACDTALNPAPSSG